MIPTMLVAGLVAGVLPARWAIAGVALLGLLWTVLVVISDPAPSTDLETLVGTFGLGVANAAVGAVVSHLVRQTVLAAISPH